MKKILIALTVCLTFSCASYAQDAVFTSLDTVEEIQKINLEPVDVPKNSNLAPATSSVQKLPTTFQEASYKKAITSLDDASAGVREQLINYNSQLSAAKMRLDQAKSEVKELKSYVRDTKKKMKNIEKSKKYINANFETQQTDCAQ